MTNFKTLQRHEAVAWEISDHIQQAIVELQRIAKIPVKDCVWSEKAQQVRKVVPGLIQLLELLGDDIP